ncbi:hypothetical protein Tco_0950787 [Tanacetum coccineum]
MNKRTLGAKSTNQTHPCAVSQPTNAPLWWWLGDGDDGEGGDGGGVVAAEVVTSCCCRSRCGDGDGGVAVAGW